MVEILRCSGCGFRIKGFPAQYLSRRVVTCPQCRLESPLSIEDRLRLKRLVLESGGIPIRSDPGRALA